MKICFNKNEEKEVKTLMGFELVHNGKKMFFCTELHNLIPNSFQNYT